MSQREEFVALAQSEGVNMSELMGSAARPGTSG